MGLSDKRTWDIREDYLKGFIGSVFRSMYPGKASPLFSEVSDKYTDGLWVALIAHVTICGETTTHVVRERVLPRTPGLETRAICRRVADTMSAQIVRAASAA
jgi:hypothetical protein